MKIKNIKIEEYALKDYLLDALYNGLKSSSYEERYWKVDGAIRKLINNLKS